MVERFDGDAVDESGRSGDRLRFDLTEDLGYRYPGSEDPDADRRLGGTPPAAVSDRYGGRPERRGDSRRSCG